MRHNYENMIGLSRFLQLLETTKKPVTFFKDHNGIQNLGTGLLPKPAKTSPPQRHSERTDSTMHRILPRTISLNSHSFQVLRTSSYVKISDFIMKTTEKLESITQLLG